MKKVGEKCVLSDLKVDQTAKILKLNETNKAIRRHLLDMGMTRDTIVTIKKIAPAGQYKITDIIAVLTDEKGNDVTPRRKGEA